MIKIVLSLLIIYAQISFAQLAKNFLYQSYLSHISAANSSLRLNEKTEAQRWLQNAPKEFRGWEWNYLNNRIDESEAKLELKYMPTKISYSKNGKYFAFGDLEGIIHIYNTETLEEVKSIQGHLNTVYSVKFMDDDSKLVSCSRDTTIRLWDFSSGKELW